MVMIISRNWRLSWSFFCCRREIGVYIFEHVKIKPILGPLMVGEGPHWDKASGALLFVDILGKAIHRYIPATSFHKKLPLKDTVSFIVPVREHPGKYMIGLGMKLALLTWDGTTVTHTIEEIKSFPGEDTRLNDGKADHLGNMWTGSMAKEKEGEIGEVLKYKGMLFRYGVQGDCKTIDKPISISNGMAWNLRRNLMYYIDSVERRVDVFDYNSETGEVCKRRPFFDFKVHNVKGLPDGMTVDCDDNLWVACYGASQVAKISGKTGHVLGLLKFPTELISSVTFGGELNDVMYVTSISYGLRPEQLDEQPKAGFLFEVKDLGVTGPEPNSAVLPNPDDCA